MEEVKRFVVSEPKEAYINCEDISSIFEGCYETNGDCITISLRNGQVYPTQYYNINFVNAGFNKTWVDLFFKIVDKWQKK